MVETKFKCSECLLSCIKAEVILKRYDSRYKFINHTISSFLESDEKIRGKEIPMVRNEKESRIICSNKLDAEIEKEEKFQMISKSEVIRRSLYRYFEAENEKELEKKEEELRRKITEKILGIVDGI